MNRTAYLTRAPSYGPQGWLFTIGSEQHPATAENDCCVPFQAPEPDVDGVRTLEYPPCPDCNGPVIPFNSETNSGLLRCSANERESSCGSVFADSRSHWYSRKHRCERHPDGITDAPVWDPDEPWTMKAHEERETAETELKRPPEHLWIFRLTTDRRKRWNVQNDQAVVAVLEYGADGHLYGALQCKEEYAELLQGLGIDQPGTRIGPPSWKAESD